MLSDSTLRINCWTTKWEIPLLVPMLVKVTMEMDKAVRNSLLMVGRMILILSILGRTKIKMI